MTIKAIKREPLYLAVKNRIWEEISHGKLSKELPTEKEFCQMYKVSRATIRSALQELKKEKVIRTVHGIGTFVNKSGSRIRMRIDKFNGFFQLIQESGYTPSVQDLPLQELKGIAVEYNNISLPDVFSKEIILLERIIKSSDLPAILVKEFIPKSYLKPDANLTNFSNSIYEIVDDITETHIYYTISEICPVLSDNDLHKHINVKPGLPIIMIRERHFSTQDDMIVFSEAYVNDDVIRFNVIRTE